MVRSKHSAVTRFARVAVRHAAGHVGNRREKSAALSRAIGGERVILPPSPSDAEAALKEAADIWRELVAQNPAAYRPDLRSALNNLGVLYDDTHRFADAEAALKEAAGQPAGAGGAEPRRLPARPGGDAQQPGRSLRRHRGARRRGRLQGGRRHPAGAGRAEPGRLPARPRADARQPGRSLRRHAWVRRRRGRLRRPPTSSARWRRRTRPPTGPILHRRSTTLLLCTGTCIAITMPKSWRPKRGPRRA